MHTAIVFSAMNTPYGAGAGACWSGLMEGRSAIAGAGEFARREFLSQNAAAAPCRHSAERSRAMGLIAPLLDEIKPHVPEDAALVLATTTGEIDMLERGVLSGDARLVEKAHPVNLLVLLQERLGLIGQAEVVSAACASSSAALARAASMIKAGRCSAVLVVGVDALSEFVFAGFSTLMALSPERARPFDRGRDGLTLGEAASMALLMEPGRAVAENREVQGTIDGWGIACDANHMTGPSRDGGGLAGAVKEALLMASCAPEDIASVCAHGTGTVYNDAMEMKAYRSVFKAAPVPVYSVKGGMGHTMGAAGLTEVLIALESMKEGVAPPTVGLDEPDSDAGGWVCGRPVEVKGNTRVLSANSGFGGVNCAIVAGGPP